MMEHIVSVLREAEDISLVSLHDARIGLNMTGVSADTDRQVELMVRWASSEIARFCNRVLAQETVEETFLEINAQRVFLTRFPVKTIETIYENGILLTSADYEIDAAAGKLVKPDLSAWTVPIVITYTGGYDCPNEVPPDLAKAAVLMTRSAYYAAVRGDASIRMVSHKGSRVMYFDPNAAAAKQTSSSSGATMTRAVTDLLTRYVRYIV
jgi:hypothetical protein